MTALQQLLAKARKELSDGNRHTLSAALRPLYENHVQYYHQSISEGLEGEYADALYKILLLGMDEEDEDSVELAELAYLALSNRLRHPGIHGLEYKTRLLLLNSFYEYLTDSVTCACFAQYRKTDLLLARQLADECLEKMQIADLLYLEENCPEILDEDENAAAACNLIESDINLSPEDRQQAILLHQIFHTYLQTKYPPRKA